MALLATAAIFSCPEYHTFLASLEDVDLTEKVKQEILAEVKAVTEIGCFKDEFNGITTP